jgi:hypothetical protein
MSYMYSKEILNVYIDFSSIEWVYSIQFRAFFMV